MKLFRCSNGSLINPLLVVSVEVISTDEDSTVHFCHIGGWHNSKHSSKAEAEVEKNRFKEHFETEMKL